jgi:hypothetical protein
VVNPGSLRHHGAPLRGFIGRRIILASAYLAAMLLRKVRRTPAH